MPKFPRCGTYCCTPPREGKITQTPFMLVKSHFPSLNDGKPLKDMGWKFSKVLDSHYDTSKVSLKTLNSTPHITAVKKKERRGLFWTFWQENALTWVNEAAKNSLMVLEIYKQKCHIILCTTFFGFFLEFFNIVEWKYVAAE